METTDPSPASLQGHGHKRLARAAHRAPSAAELLRFRTVVGRARRVLESVAEELFRGITEHSAARILTQRLHAAGATDYLVEPRVLFGDRTTLPRRAGHEDPRPGWSSLDLSEPYLLEAVPLFEGLPAPASVCGGLEGSPMGLRAGERLLEEVRALILSEIRQGASARDLARSVERLGRRRGWRDTTAPKPGWTLARHLEHLPTLLSPPGAPFGGGSIERMRLFAFAGRRKLSATRALTPVWSDDSACETPIRRGLWMVAPRFSRGSLGVLQRDLLWLDEDGPRWLDEGPLPRR